MRHRLPHFGHLFAGAAYAAGYYVYMWAEVLDADGFDAFVEAGTSSIRRSPSGSHRYVYSSGGTLDPAAAYRAFRGRDPAVEPMLAKRGLIDDDRVPAGVTKPEDRALARKRPPLANPLRAAAVEALLALGAPRAAMRSWLAAASSPSLRLTECAGEPAAPSVRCCNARRVQSLLGAFDTLLYG